MDKKFVLAGAVLFAAVAFAGPKNVILFIGDGMSTPQRMTADEFALKAGHEPLAMNRLPYSATTRTCSASSLVTDSAAAATAIACGVKTYNGALGLDADGKRAESVAEMAKAGGRKVGIVTTVMVNHATPAGFFAHRKDRSDGYGAGLDLIASGFDYFAGGWALRPVDSGHKEYHGNFYQLAQDAGYRYIDRDRKAFDSLKPGCGKVLYIAEKKRLPFAIDAVDRKDVPTLAELTAKGLELLENPDGFFMMVEGGSVDWAGHANDAATNLREVLALDDAVRVALDWQKEHPDTLVVVTGDHETGGMAMGFEGTGYAFYMDRLARQKCSAQALSDFFWQQRPQKFEEIQPFLAEKFGLVFEEGSKDPMALTAQEKQTLAEAFERDLEAARAGKKETDAYDAAKITRLPTVVKELVSHRAGIGWTSGAHTALPVLTTAKGPGAERFTGYIDNTDISKILKALIAE